MNEREQISVPRLGAMDQLPSSSIKNTPIRHFGIYQSKYLTYSSKPTTSMNYPPISNPGPQYNKFTTDDIKDKYIKDTMLKSSLEEEKDATIGFQPKTFVNPPTSGKKLADMTYTDTETKNFYPKAEPKLGYVMPADSQIIPIKYEKPYV